jgi:hypothetical protein
MRLRKGADVRQTKREPKCLLRLAGSAQEVFDTLNIMAAEESDVPEELSSIVYEADDVGRPFPFEMTPEDWMERLLKARRQGIKP